MKKLIIALLALGVIGMFAMPAHAEGLEMAGSVVAGLGYQHQNNKASTELTADDAEASVAGPIGRYIAAEGPTQDNFQFFVDSVELDLMKSFGENIRLRADLDFGRFQSGSNFGGFFLEQAYATANIPLGNGIEMLIGRFNVPIGFESVDVTDNDTISKSILIRSGIRPTNTTGLKFYYAFSDLVDFHLYIANRLTRDNLRAKITDIPSAGMRLGFNWGEQGNESTFGISGFFGPEHDIASNKHFTFGGDLDLNWWVTEAFALGMEGIFRKDNAIAAGFGNTKTFGGLLNLKYVFSDSWDAYIKYVMVHQSNGGNGQWNFIGSPFPPFGVAMAAVKQTVHEMSLGGNYRIADGATLKIEGRGDIILPPKGHPGRAQFVCGAAIAFGYDF